MQVPRLMNSGFELFLLDVSSCVDGVQMHCKHCLHKHISDARYVLLHFRLPAPLSGGRERCKRSWDSLY